MTANECRWAQATSKSPDTCSHPDSDQPGAGKRRKSNHEVRQSYDLNISHMTDGALRRLTWGPTTDNVLAHLLHYGNHLVMTGGFWREEHLRRHPEHVEAVFVAEIEPEELAGILQGAIAALNRGPASAESCLVE